MHSRSICRPVATYVAFALALVFTNATAAAAQGTTVSGRLYHSVSTKPVAAATVSVEGTKLETKSAADGTYSIANVPAGSYHLIVVAKGYVPTRSELTVSQSPVVLDVAVDPELHYSEVVSVSPDARSQFDSYQPTTVLAGQDLSKQLGGTVGATLATQPGVAERSFGPGPSRPVIRGLDGDRVLILDDGQRVGDLSSQSADHGVPLNPAGASKIEVVRGPATLLYGTNAIGGLVNVISDTIPTQRVSGASGGATFDLGSAAGEVGGAGDVRWGNNQWAVHVLGSGRRSGDVDTPEGEIANTQSRGGFGISRPRVDRRAWLLRRQLRVRQHEIRPPLRRRGSGPAHAAPADVRLARGRGQLRRGIWLVSGAVRVPALSSRRARGRRGRHAVREQHHGSQRAGQASPSGAG